MHESTSPSFPRQPNPAPRLTLAHLLSTDPSMIPRDTFGVMQHAERAKARKAARRPVVLRPLRGEEQQDWRALAGSFLIAG